MKSLGDVVIVDYLRSAWSRARPKEPEKDIFNSLRADDMLASLVITMLGRNKVPGESVDEMIVGAAYPWGEHVLGGGRNLVFLSKLPFSVAAHGVERLCATSMTAIHHGAMSIALGFSEVVIAGGMEHMTHVPMLTPGIDAQSQPIKNNPRFFSGGEFNEVDFPNSIIMGLTAEKLANLEHISREEMDTFSLRSHQLSHKALNEGFFKGEILPFEVTTPENKRVVVDYDVGIRPDTTLEALSRLTPSFKPDGVITAGNSSQLADGASAVILMSREKAVTFGLKPLASFVSLGWAGVDPTVMGKGPVPASQKALKYAGLDTKDIDYWEINEAFAIVPLYAMRELKIDLQRVNINGGSVAIGHPLGASGARLVGTLARILDNRKAQYGVATLCVGRGQGVTTIIKREVQ